MDRVCKKHGLTSHEKRSDRSSWRCRKCSSEKVTRRRRVLKSHALEYKGGCCVLCGYNKCIDALEFHHIDPNEKDFKISSANKSWDSIQKELDKCVLMCSNCHRELHSGLLADGILGEYA